MLIKIYCYKLFRLFTVPHIRLNIRIIPDYLLAILFRLCITGNKLEYNAWIPLRLLINILKLSDN